MIYNKDKGEVLMKTSFTIARVTHVNKNKYTVDLKDIEGRSFYNVPFLTPYNKPLTNGQGIYQMPERDSYAVVLLFGSGMLKKDFGKSKIVLGFYSPIDEKGSYDGGRDEIQPGDINLKTLFGNRITLRTDGSIEFKASDQAQIHLYPESGNERDSYGYDNLLRILLENFELVSSGGMLEQKVNKKSSDTYLSFEFRDKALYPENPRIIRGRMGFQDPLDGTKSFFVLDSFDTESDGEEETHRYHYEWENDGHIIIKHFDIDEIERYHFEITDIGKKTIIKHNENGEKTYQKELSPMGHKTVEHFDGGEIEYRKNTDPSGATRMEIFDAGTLVYERFVGSDGSSTENIDDEVTIEKTPAGDIDVYASGDVTVTVDGTAVVNCDDIKLGSDMASEQVLLGNLFEDHYLNHTHIGNMGSPTSPLIEPPNPAYLSDITKSD